MTAQTPPAAGSATVDGVDGANVREAREARGYDRTTFADLMGVSRRRLVAVERNLAPINERELRRVRFLTNLPPHFFTRSPRPAPTGTLFVCTRPPWA